MKTDIIEESVFPRAQGKRGLSISNKFRNWRTKFIGRTTLKKLEKHWLTAGFEPRSGGCWGYCELCYTTLHHLHQTTISRHTTLHCTALHSTLSCISWEITHTSLLKPTRILRCWNGLRIFLAPQIGKWVFIVKNSPFAVSYLTVQTP